MNPKLRLDDLSDELTDAFINYQWRLENPMPVIGETYQMRVRAYQTNSIFHAKVTTLAAGVVDIVYKWLEKADEG